ncbi:MAG: hypothetical protein Q4C85_08530 [Actinomyces sp.]|uniref:hypothetical protein n=1 Tax=Actinomyces sp. TaxID=29317 RepID=UPI0026DCF852|nr:hypothetical protein [Actinomyces sp.]MDO4243783.1 hypothetical protein [Actinomyces sp.]
MRSRNSSREATLSTVLDQAIKNASRPGDEWDIDKMTTRDRLTVITKLAAEAGMRPQFQMRSRQTLLALVACLAAQWAASVLEVDGADIWCRVRAEYERAHLKHSGMTPYNQGMSDDDRTYILLEEVGEVARACTPDAHTPTGHAGELGAELIQTATMATAWLARVLTDACAPISSEGLRAEGAK